MSEAAAPMASSRVLVRGAGIIGTRTHLAERLLGSGHEVSCLCLDNVRARVIRVRLSGNEGMRIPDTLRTG